MQDEQLRNPITGQTVDEIIKQGEAEKRGYLELEFIMRYLEDENEFCKFFIIEGKRVIVDMNKPMTQYKKKPQINYERVHQTETKTPTTVVPTVPSGAACSIDDEGCISCSG